MPVPTSLNDLSTTPASNFPAGSESPSVLDDTLRAHAALMATLRDQKQDASAISAFGLTLLDDADGAAALTTLGAVSKNTAETIAGQKTFSQPVLLGNGGVKFSSDAAADTGLDWVSDGVFRATCNAVPVLDISEASILSRGSAIGYGAGAGGAVQQTGFITNAVTLHKRSGVITTVTDTLGAGSLLAFSLTNNLSTEDDLMLINLVNWSASEPGLWVRCHKTATTSVWRISIRNDTGITQSGPFTIKFALIRMSAV